MTRPSGRSSKRSPDNEDPRPLHEQIAADLRRIILDDLEPGDKLPITKDLQERFGKVAGAETVASATIVRAVGILKQEGLVEGRSGARITVTGRRREVLTPAMYSQPAEAGAQYRWISEAEQAGKQPAIELLEVREVPPPRHVAQIFSLERGEPALLRKQLLFFEPEPYELAHSYYPLSLVRGTAMMEKKKIRGGTPKLLADLGYPPRETVDDVMSEEPTTEECRLLRLPPQVGVLRTFRVVISDEEIPIEVSNLAKAGHMYSLRYRY